MKKIIFLCFLLIIFLPVFIFAQEETNGPAWNFKVAEQEQTSGPEPKETNGPAWNFKVRQLSTGKEPIATTSLVWSFVTKNNAPQVPDQDMKITSQAYCGIKPGQGLAQFQWTYFDEDGDDEIGFDFQVDNDSDFSSPAVNRKYCTTFSSSINSQILSVDFSPSGSVIYGEECSGGTVTSIPDKLSYGAVYYWRVKVYDEQGDSGWITAPSSLSTPAHAYPYPDFVVSPAKPVLGQEIQFIQNNSDFAESFCYDGGEHLCESDFSASYKWDFNYDENIGFTPDSFYKGNATTTYSAAGQYVIKLEIVDNVGTCVSAQSIGQFWGLPKWREVSP